MPEILFISSVVVFIVLIFLLTLILSAVEGDKYKDNRDSTRQNDDSSHKRYDTENQAIVSTIANAIHTYRRDRRADEHDRAKREKATIVVLAVTAIFALFAAGAAIYSAIIFTGQLNEMRVSSAVVQRAFITVTELSIKRGNANRFLNGTPESRFWMLTPQIENSGTTPTRNLRWIVAPGFTFASEEEIPNAAADVEAQTPNLDQAWNYGILGPRSRMSLDFAGNASGLLDTAAADLAPGIVKMLFQGVIRYNDIFADIDEHITKFCYWIRVDFSNAERTSVGDPYARQCGGHTNCADDECKKRGATKSPP
jgi:hypothetical protein